MTFEPSEEKLFVQFKGHICDQWSWDRQCNYCSGEVLLEVYLLPRGVVHRGGGGMPWGQRPQLSLGYSHLHHCLGGRQLYQDDSVSVCTHCECACEQWWGGTKLLFHY